MFFHLQICIFDFKCVYSMYIMIYIFVFFNKMYVKWYLDIDLFPYVYYVSILHIDYIKWCNCNRPMFSIYRNLGGSLFYILKQDKATSCWSSSWLTQPASRPLLGLRSTWKDMSTDGTSSFRIFVVGFTWFHFARIPVSEMLNEGSEVWNGQESDPLVKKTALLMCDSVCPRLCHDFRWKGFSKFNGSVSQKHASNLGFVVFFFGIWRHKHLRLVATMDTP